MIKTLILTLIFSVLACDLISQKGSHALLLKLEQELMNYNMKAKQEQMTFEKEKKAFVASNRNNGSNPRSVLSQEAQKYLDQQISESKALEQKCKDIIKKTSDTIKEIDDLDKKALKLEKQAKYIKSEFDRARNGADIKWRKDIEKVHKLSDRAQFNISPAKEWTKESKRIYQSLKGSIETAISVLKYTHQLGEEIKTGLIPENWTIRISENNQSLNDIIKKCETTLKEYNDKQKANNFVKELEKDVQEALSIIEYTTS